MVISTYDDKEEKLGAAAAAVKLFAFLSSTQLTFLGSWKFWKSWKFKKKKKGGGGLVITSICL